MSTHQGVYSYRILGKHVFFVAFSLIVMCDQGSRSMCAMIKRIFCNLYILWDQSINSIVTKFRAITTF